MVPPLNSNHKEVMFYYSETFNNYMREHVFGKEIKLLDGDVGLTFLEFQMVICRVATEVSKENKLELAVCLDKFIAHLNLAELIKTRK